VLYYLLAARNYYSDFADYYKRFSYNNAKLIYSCRWYKSLIYLFYYRKVDPRHRIRLLLSPVVAIDRAIGRDFKKFIKLA
jgi:hypothetical protein